MEMEGFMKVWLRRALVTLLCLFLSVSAFAFTDKDGDGMDDAWEKKYNLDPENPMDADLDLDGDKVNNLDEFKKGTNPTDGKDRNGNGLPDDWEVFYFGKTTGIKADGDPDKDGFTNKQEFDNGTNPLVKDKKKKVASNFKRPIPKMSGVRSNGSMSHKHIIGKNKIVFRDPIGDDKGPGYYTYPTNPVYKKGSFDITKVEIDGSSDNKVVFRVTINADLKQEWGMDADFDVQHVQIYIDTDGEPGSGNVRTLPGLNVYIHPSHAWDRVVIISPQPYSRVSIEVEAKGKQFENYVVIPKKIVGQGRTLIATVLKKELGVDKDTDISTWKYQVFMQSNEGFPDKEDLLTRNVNEYNGLHRFGGGNDYWGDPEVMDMLAFPAKGLKIEAKRQFDILNVWESYPDPTKDIRAVVPMVWAGQKKKVNVKGLAADLASKMKPKPQPDKHVSNNFNFFGKMFTRWSWNMDINSENFLKGSFELGIDGKVFTDKLDFYIRFEQDKWDESIWHDWKNDTPNQNNLAIQSSRLTLVKLIPTVDQFTIGNYEVNYSPWIAGAAWYPDRDKFKGFFVDGNVSEGTLLYKLAMFYPLEWQYIGRDPGSLRGMDWAYVAKVQSSRLIPGLDFAVTGYLLTDLEANPVKIDLPTTSLLHTYSPAIEAHASYKLPGGLTVGGLFAHSAVKLSDDWKNLEAGSEIDYDGSTTVIKDSHNNMDHETSASAFLLNVKGQNFLNSGIDFHLQYFNISPEYCAPGAARGDLSFNAGGFGTASTAATADVLAMIGNQTAHRTPQVKDFMAKIPMPGLPSQFMVRDPETEYIAIGWVNDNWEGVAAQGWKGLTGIFKYSSDVWRMHAEVSYIGFRATSLSNFSKLRGYAAFSYNFMSIGRGLNATVSCMYEQIIEKDKYSYVVGITPATKDGGTVYLSPMLKVDYNFSKFLQGSASFRYEFGSVNDGDPSTDNLIYGRTRIGFSLSLSLPLGFIRTRGEYWFEKEGDFVGRAPHGLYTVTEWEYAF